MTTCPKCHGLMVQERYAGDFYLILQYLRCVQCGKQVETSAQEVSPQRERVGVS